MIVKSIICSGHFTQEKKTTVFGSLLFLELSFVDFHWSTGGLSLLW